MKGWTILVNVENAEKFKKNWNMLKKVEEWEKLWKSGKIMWDLKKML